MEPETILADLNEPQLKAVQHVDGPLLVVAGAGSGKTRVITRRVAYLICRGVHPQSILAITFTNKAANEMRTRVRSLMATGPAGTPMPLIATFHAFSALLLRTHGRAIGVEPNFTIFDQTDRLKLIKTACADAGALPAGLSAAKVAARIDAAKREMIAPDQLDRLDGLPDYHRPIIARIYGRYQKLLAENAGLDFDDLLIRAIELLDDPGAGESIRRKYQYLLIDEYQDTNRMQYQIARKLTRDSRNICATGDPDQAIYAWRGADIRNIMEFQQDYPDAEVVFLETNYRSTAHILNAADSVISNNVLRKPKTLIPVHDEGILVEVHACDDELEEAQQVVEIIHQAQADGMGLGEIAVFSRVNSLLRTVEQSLIKAEIPYELARGTGFFRKKEIKDLVGYLRAVANPGDRFALERIINTPARGIGSQTKSILKTFAAESAITLYEAVHRAGEIPQVGKSVQNIMRFADLLDRLTALKTECSPSELVEQVIELTGLGRYYEKQGQKNSRPDELSPRANLDEFVGMMRAFENGAEPTLENILAQVALVSDVDTVTGAADRVTLLTMHGAKGLEFTVVIIIAAEEEIIPHVLSMPDKIEEERRLFFVAMTRTKRLLHICCTHCRSVRTGRKRTMISRFVKEIDPKTLSNFDPSEFDKPQTNFQFVITPRRAENADAVQTSTPRCPYRSGQRIYHNMFGHGVIEEIHLSGGHFMGSIRFQAVGMKKIALDVAPVQAVR